MRWRNFIYGLSALVHSLYLPIIANDYDWVLYSEYISEAKTKSLVEYFDYTYRTEYLFDIYMWLYGNTNLPVIGFLVLNGFLSSYLLLRALNTLLGVHSVSKVILLSFVFFLDLPYYHLNANILRQQLAMSLFLFLLSLGYKSVFNWSFLLHTSSLIFNVVSNTKHFYIVCVAILVILSLIENILLDLTHSLYDPPSYLFFTFLIFSVIVLRKHKLLFNYGLLLLVIVTGLWEVTQLSSRLVLYGHPCLIGAIFILLSRAMKVFINTSSIKWS